MEICVSGGISNISMVVSSLFVELSLFSVSIVEDDTLLIVENIQNEEGEIIIICMYMYAAQN